MHLSDLFVFHTEEVPESDLSFAAFLRQKAGSLILYTLILIALYTTVLCCIEIHTWYAFLLQDPLFYILHGMELIRQHSTDLMIADNMQAIPYVGLPGYLRIPLLALPFQFETIFKILQIANVLTLMLLGLLMSYLVFLYSPNRLKTSGIVLVYISLLLSPVWESNVVLPLSDSIFACLLCIAMILIRQTTNTEGKTSTIYKLVSIVLLILLAGSVKYFGFLLVPYAISRWYPVLSRKYTHLFSRMSLFILAIMTITIAASWTTMLPLAQIYYSRMVNDHWYDCILNLLACSLPSVVIAPYYHLYSPGFSLTYLHFNWLATPKDIVLTGIGILISFVCFAGAVRTFRKFSSEILLLLAIMLISSVITTSTTRYLHCMQFFCIALFLHGADLIIPGHLSKRTRYALSAMAPVFLVLLVMARISFRSNHAFVSHKNGFVTISNYQKAYQAEESFIENLPEKTKVRFIYFPDTILSSGKWLAIQDVRYIAPDRNLDLYAGQYDLYAVFDASRSRLYTVQDNRTPEFFLEQLQQYGHFRATMVLNASNNDIVCEIYRITPLQ